MNGLQVFSMLWLVLAAAVLLLAAYRRTVARHIDDELQHVLEGHSAQVTGENARLQQIDRWGKLLTIVGVAYGVLLGLAYLYRAWVNPNPGM
jgi:hypothetical protein